MDKNKQKMQFLSADFNINLREYICGHSDWQNLESTSCSNFFTKVIPQKIAAIEKKNGLSSRF